MKNYSVFKLATSVIALTGASLLSQAAYAQAGAGQQAQDPAQVAPPPSSEFSEDDISTIIVTGTAIRGVAPVGSATVDITRDTIAQSGVRDASSLIAQLPQGSGLGTTLETSGGRSAGLNLRGLGNGATLLLFDGHRTVGQNRNAITDPNLVPFIAVDRVEVVTDGASAIYGSDAVAGVVNYILRRPFDGAEITARYTHTLYDAATVEMVAGHTWDSGGVVAAFAVEGNTSVREYDIPGLRADLTPFGGNDNRFFGTTFNAVGRTGALLVGNTVYGLPDDLNGRTPTAAELEPLKGNPELVDRTELQDFYTKRRRYSAMVRIEQDLGNLGEITLTGLYSRRTNQARGQGDGSFQTIAINVPSDSDFYVDELGGRQQIVYNFRLNNPDRALNRNDHLNTGNILLDYQVPLFADFRLSVSGGYGKSEGCEVCQPQANTILTSQLASPGQTVTDFNPYILGPQDGAEKIFGVFIQNSTHQFYNLVPKIDGALFSLPAGEVRVAVGGEYLKTKYLHNSLYSLNPTTTLQDFRVANSSRDVWSAFGEAFIPVFGPDNAIPGFQRLDLNAAIRYDKYSDVGSTTNPKFGITWEPFNDLLLRGSYGTSFRAPTLSDTNFNIVGAASRTYVQNNLNDPDIPVTDPLTGRSLILNSSFRFAQLRPETAKVMSAGADYTPSFVPGLKLGVTWYSVDYKDRISSLPAANTVLSDPETYALYKEFFTIAPQPDDGTCVNGSANGNPGAPEYATYNPLYLPYLNAPGSYPPTTANDCDLVGILDSSTRNLGRVKQSGLDFLVNYQRDMSFGTLTLNGSFTKILQLKRNVLPGTPLVSALDVIGEQVSGRGRFSAGLRNGPFSGVVAANYVGSYTNDQTPTVDGVKLPDAEIPAWTTFDLNLSYAPEATSGIFSGTRFTVSARNFTDKDPPIVLTSNSAVDDGQHSLFGRIITLEVSKEF